jgi:signal transduction histidine kinase
MKKLLIAGMFAVTAHARGAENPAWVERLAFWAAPELRRLGDEIDGLQRSLSGLSSVAGVNSGNRTGYQSAGNSDGQDMWVKIELVNASPVDSVVLVPLLARGSSGDVAGFGFPKRFILEGTDWEGKNVILMDETAEDYPNPGLYPVSAACPPGTILRSVRLMVVEPWRKTGPPVLAMSEILLLDGNRNVTSGAKVTSATAREIPPTWSRSNLVDMMMPIGLPLAPGGSEILGWHGPVATSMNQQISVTVDLGKSIKLDEIRLFPAWRRSMGWDTYYGFPSRFKIEGSADAAFGRPVMIHDQTNLSLLSPGQNIQRFSGPDSPVRFVRMTATRLRDRSGDFTFALGELQAYAGNVNVAVGARVIADASLENSEWSRAGLTDNSSKGETILELPEWFRSLERRRILETQLAGKTQLRSQLFTRAEHTLVTASICGASGIALMAGLFSWRGQRQRGLDRERHRERLARDLHDELGSNLGSIALISSLAGQEGADQMRLDLAEIERVARESADSMRDMVSLLGGKRGGVAADWLNVMTGLAERLMRGAELECRLPTSPLIWEPNLETRREIYLFCKEVLHNAAKHGHPSRLKFHLSPTSAGLRMEISDDGCGFEPDGLRSGHGLGNLRERAAMMRGHMTLETAPGAGTSVILDIPRGRRWTKR